MLLAPPAANPVILEVNRHVVESISSRKSLHMPAVEEVVPRAINDSSFVRWLQKAAVRGCVYAHWQWLFM